MLSFFLDHTKDKLTLTLNHRCRNSPITSCFIIVGILHSSHQKNSCFFF